MTRIRALFFVPLLSITFLLNAQRRAVTVNFHEPDDSFIQYTGRIDFTNPKLPRFWQPGVSITVKVKGSVCRFIVNDEELWGKNHNYLELIVDGKATRLQTKSKRDTISVSGLSDGIHVISLVKNTEANIGYLELVGINSTGLLKPDTKPQRKIEFIGNSITCGTGADQSQIPCGKGVWQDQHNAYFSYGAITARELNTQYHLSSVSGIGLMRSCCNMNILMPQVFDKISMRNDTIQWDFSKYQPDVVTICLGQNDGIQDSTAFCNNYISFLKTLRGHYQHTQFILLSSPMANKELREFQRKTILSVVNAVQQSGDKKITHYIFEKQYSSGCDWHPDLKEHGEIANELITFIKNVKDW